MLVFCGYWCSEHMQGFLKCITAITVFSAQDFGYIIIDRVLAGTTLLVFFSYTWNMWYGRHLKACLACELYIEGFVQNYCNYLILYKELQKFCTKPSIWLLVYWSYAGVSEAYKEGFLQSTLGIYTPSHFKNPN